jgi:hypothetical protein
MAMHSALEVVSEYMSAMAAQDNARMNSLCSPDFVMDLVHCDVFEGRPLSVEQTKEFWPCWFAAFPLAWPCLESHSQAESSRCILTRCCTRRCTKEIFIP